MKSHGRRASRGGAERDPGWADGHRAALKLGPPEDQRGSCQVPPAARGFARGRSAAEPRAGGSLARDRGTSSSRCRWDKARLSPGHTTGSFCQTPGDGSATSQEGRGLRGPPGKARSGSSVRDHPPTSRKPGWAAPTPRPFPAPRPQAPPRLPAPRPRYLELPRSRAAVRSWGPQSAGARGLRLRLCIECSFRYCSSLASPKGGAPPCHLRRTEAEGERAVVRARGLRDHLTVSPPN